MARHLARTKALPEFNSGAGTANHLKVGVAASDLGSDAIVANHLNLLGNDQIRLMIQGQRS